MSKNQWDIVFQPKSFLKIGSGQMGMLETTELYIPGRVIWGAMVAYIATKNFESPPRKIYKETGDKLGQNERFFSSFFPSFDKGSNIFIPMIEGGTTYWKEINIQEKKFTGKLYSDKDFRSLLTVCYSSTAYDPQFCSAKDETLHSMEVISPKITLKNNDKFEIKDVCFRGTIYIPSEIEIENKKIKLNKDELSDIFNCMRVGGESKTGCGIIQSVDIKESNPEINDLTFIEVENEVILTSPVHTVDQKNNIKGIAFLSLYRQYCENKGYGKDFTKPNYCWQVGSVADNNFKSSYNLQSGSQN